MFLNWYGIDQFGEVHYRPKKPIQYIKNIIYWIKLNKRIIKEYRNWPHLAIIDWNQKRKLVVIWLGKFEKNRFKEKLII